MGGKRGTLHERFMDKFIITDSGCWEWTAFTNKKGYGKFTSDGKCYRAHRLSYELHVGEIPEGMNVCHNCDNRKCINPDHLFLGTQADNILDMRLKGRGSEEKLTENDVKEIRSSKGISQRKLAKKYNVSQRLIWNILNDQAWKHIQ